MRLLALSLGLTLVVAPAGSAADGPLESLAWLVGGTWVSELKPPKGEPLTVRMTTFGPDSPLTGRSATRSTRRRTRTLAPDGTSRRPRF
jgi:hypothetical protein